MQTLLEPRSVYATSTVIHCGNTKKDAASYNSTGNHCGKYTIL